MPPIPHLDPLASSIAQVLGIFGLSLLLTWIVRPERALHRVALYAGVWFFSLRYIWWRATATLAPAGLTLDALASWSFFGIELLSIVSALSASVIMSRTRNRSGEADRNLGWWKPGGDPRVAVLIPTYNEELEILERTIIGARALRYSNKQIVVLDDGRRDWLRDYCAAHSVSYLRRDGNAGAKAGNLNNALRVLADSATPPDFVAVLDADFVPHLEFLERTLALFHDPKVAIVQTPQHFFNADPVQQNLGLASSYPDEQRYFFDHVQPSRDAWNIALCCGTSSLIRWSALQEVGGFPTDSVTEDYMLTQVMRDLGWNTVYLNEPLTEGLAPEGLKEYITQRGRWCLGTMQIARSRVGPFGRSRITLPDRWSILDATLYWSSTFVFRIAALVYPLLYWFGNIIVVDARVEQAVSYFGCYFVWSLMTINLLSRNIMMPLLTEVQQLLGAFPITYAAFLGLFSGQKHSFKVTAKGGERSAAVVQWALMKPFIILFALTALGIFIGIFSDRFAFSDAGDGKMVILFWSIYNLFVLGVTLISCVELPRYERHIVDEPERTVVRLGHEPRRVWITDLTLDTVRLRGHRYEEERRGKIRVPRVGNVECFVVAETADGARLQLLPNDAQRKRLFQRFYSRGANPGVSNVRVTAVLRDIVERILS